MSKLSRAVPVALLMLVGLLVHPMGYTPGTIIYADQGERDSACVNLPSQANDRAATATSKNSKLCTPTPTNIPTATATLIDIPTDIPTATPTDTATNTPLPTSTPTNTPIPTNTATTTPSDTPTLASTNTPTATNTPLPTFTPTNTATPVPSANITVYNTGSFFVQYYLSYSLPGLPLQSLYSGVFNINQGVTLTIPRTATNVGVLIQHYTGITGWQTACSRSYAQATNAVIIVSGTPFFPSCTGG